VTLRRGLSWKHGGPGLYWAELGEGRRAWVERVESGSWLATVRSAAGMIEMQAEADSLWRAKAWAEGLKSAAACASNRNGPATCSRPGPCTRKTGSR